MWALQATAKSSELTFICFAHTKVFNWRNTESSRDYCSRKAAVRSLLHNYCPANWMNDKYTAAVFKRAHPKAKMDRIIKLNGFRSDSEITAALYMFMASNQAV